MMDWHRCIGCRYCVVACPYGSRSFNWKDPRKAPNLAEIDNTYPTRMRGVVEKCTFCDERLARGELPACVEVCDNDEMVFGDLNDPESKIRRLLAEHLTIRRKPGLGTQPEVYYIVEDPRTLQEFAPAAEVFEEGGGHA
jgi:molybdopterin-containing oxidoreductase family iron-sulfur binding subunit